MSLAVGRTFNGSMQIKLTCFSTGVLAVSEIPLNQGNSVTKPVMGRQN